MSDTISSALNIAPLIKNNASVTEVIIDKAESNSIQQDFDYARGNLIAAIEKGQEALSDVVQIAGQVQSARSFEAVSSVLNAVVTANKELLELSKKKKELQKDDNAPSTVNNNLFVGSTAELLKLIKDNDKKE